jgi:hypothetical protein
VTELRADGDVLAFAAAVSVLAVLATGALPARLAARRHLRTSLVEGGRTATGNRLLDRVQSGLVVTQVCFSLVLLVGAGLLTRSFLGVLSEDRGFRSDGVVTLTVQSWSFYPRPPDRVNFVNDVVERMAALPGVKGAGMLSAIPLAESIAGEHLPLTIDGKTLAGAGEPQPLVRYVIVSPGALEALGVDLRRGRGFDTRDRSDGAPVVLVNEAFARRYFGGGTALDQRIGLGQVTDTTSPPLREIVGVVGDVRRSALSEAGEPTAYVPHAQWPTGANAFVVWGEGRPAGDAGFASPMLANSLLVPATARG